MKSPKVIVVAGPTASGKTSLGIDLAIKFGGEIISADSRQVYRGLDIGSGKVTKKETRGVPHHLIDILEPEEKYNVYQFQKNCNKFIEEISSRGKIPVIVGGTGLYIESVVEQYRFASTPSLLGEGGGAGSLQGREIDSHKLDLRPNTLVLNLNPDREQIKLNIQKRLLERWINQNMLLEVQNLINSGVDKDWLKSLGLEYKFLTQYIEGDFESEEDMLEKLNTATWQFAKRQITFLKRWYYAEEIKNPNEAVILVEKFIT